MKRLLMLLLCTLIFISFSGVTHAGLFGLFGGGQGGGKPKGRGHVDMGTIGTFDYSVFQNQGDHRNHNNQNPELCRENILGCIDAGSHGGGRSENSGGDDGPRIIIGDLGIPTIETPPPGSAPVPEPATMLLLGVGLIGLAGYGRKKLI